MCGGERAYVRVARVRTSWSFSAALSSFFSFVSWRSTACRLFSALIAASSSAHSASSASTSGRSSSFFPLRTRERARCA